MQRIGPQHQAGSDSLLTSFSFIKLSNKYFKARAACALACVPSAARSTTTTMASFSQGVEGAERHCGVLYGMGTDAGSDFAKGAFVADNGSL